jgi:hypothetical protein
MVPLIFWIWFYHVNRTLQSLNLKDMQLNNWTDVSVQQLATIVNWHTLDHMTKWFSNYMSNSTFDSVHLVITKYSVTLFGLFVREWGNNLLYQGIKIITYSDKGEKCHWNL